MKTAKITTAIATLSFVLFMSVSSIANSRVIYTGDLTKSGKKSLDITNTSDKDLSYLRFDINKYINENEETDLIHSTLDYLRFDVNNYITGTSAMELPVATEFESLRFNVNNFTQSNPDNMIELPVNEFGNLHFDVSNFTTPGNGISDELPETE